MSNPNQNDAHPSEKSRIPIEASAMLQRLPDQFFAALSSKAREQVVLGKDLINLGQGSPDQPTPVHIVQALQAAAGNPLYHKYPPFHGFSFLKEAIAERYLHDYGVKLDPETEVAVLFGAKTGLVEICSCLLNPGDVALVPDPGYPDYWSGVEMAGGRMAFMPLTVDNQFLPDYARIPADVCRRAKLMFINYPNNPTGAIAPRSFYEDTVAFAEKHGIVVASDFAYGTIGFEGKRPISFLEIPGAKEVGVEFYTLSKTYNMAGWRIGFALGHPAIIRMINLIQDHMYCSLFGGIQDAAAVALRSSQECVHALTSMYESRRNTLYTAMQEIGWMAPRSQGSFFTWLPVPKGYTSVSFANRLLDEAQVLVAPGVGFGPHGEGYVRLALLASEERLREAMKRIEKLEVFK